MDGVVNARMHRGTYSPGWVQGNTGAIESAGNPPLPPGPSGTSPPPPRPSPTPTAAPAPAPATQSVTQSVTQTLAPPDIGAAPAPADGVCVVSFGLAGSTWSSDGETFYSNVGVYLQAAGERRISAPFTVEIVNSVYLDVPDFYNWEVCACPHSIPAAMPVINPRR